MRLGFIDALRGGAICIVVFWHISVHGVGYSMYYSLLNSLYLPFFLPIFFLLSGFVGYKDSTNFSWLYTKEKVYKKISQLVFPMLMMYYIYTCWDTQDFLMLFKLGGSGKYWFTIVLFECFLLFYGCQYIGRILHRDLSLFLIIPSLLGLGIQLYQPQNNIIVDTLSLVNLGKFFQYFVLGLLIRKYWNSVDRLLTIDAIRGGLTFLYFMLYILVVNPTFKSLSLPYHFVWDILIRYVGVLTVFVWFYYYKDFFSSDFLLVKALRFIGKRTLDIYFIHYFFVPDLSFFEPYLNDFGHPFVEFAIQFPLMICLVSFSLLISQIIRSSSLLSKLLLGCS